MRRQRSDSGHPPPNHLTTIKTSRIHLHSLLTATVLATLAVAIPVTTSSCTNEEYERAAIGAAGGAIAGGLLGGGNSAAAGAVIGGLLGAGTARHRSSDYRRY